MWKIYRGIGVGLWMICLRWRPLIWEAGHMFLGVAKRHHFRRSPMPPRPYKHRRTIPAAKRMTSRPTSMMKGIRMKHIIAVNMRSEFHCRAETVVKQSEYRATTQAVRFQVVLLERVKEM